MWRQIKFKSVDVRGHIFRLPSEIRIEKINLYIVSLSNNCKYIRKEVVKYRQNGRGVYILSITDLTKQITLSFYIFVFRTCFNVYLVAKAFFEMK